VIRIGPYLHPLRSMVHELKYRRHEQMLTPLAEMLAKAVSARCETTPDVIAAVPMHWRRKWQRGYDHARQLAQAVSRQLDRPMDYDLIRIHHTPPQVNLSKTQRQKVIQGAFSLKTSSAVRDAHVLLVDDVTTTGATANEATRILLGGGAVKVSLAVIAKADPPVAYRQIAPNPL
jgi:ComF family protein